MAVAAGEEGAPLCRPDPLGHQEDADDRQRQRADDDNAETGQGLGERRPTPVM